MNQVPAKTAATGLEIAVIGMAGRFPGARTVDELWEKLASGVECISFFTDEELRASGVDEATLSDPNYVKAGGVVDDADLFDAAFFGYSPREAALLDPQQRLFLETAWTALEYAGYAPGTYVGAIGVYGGVGLNDYIRKHVLSPHSGRELDHHTAVANDKDFLTTRVSYKLNLKGPSIVVQTACSTSLVAIHLACQALIAGECDMALAGGVTIRLPQKIGYFFQEEGISSPDGHCRAFSAGAQGCLPGNGGAIVVLKRLSDALADRDCIHAVIKGSAINNDGAQKVGYTAPGVEGQAGVIRSALRVAETPADTIGYLEAHGTGTAIGDPIEIQAATQAFRQDTDQTQYCAIGAVKTNVGHLDAGAGVTGFIKAVLTVKHGVIPPTLHFDAPNPKIDFGSSPFYVNAARREWKPERGVRRAGVSSFGIGGTNAHVIVEEAPEVAAGNRRRSPELLVISAKTEPALEQASAMLAAYLREHREADLADVAFTMRCGRAQFRHRRAIVCSDVEEAITGLLESPRSRGRQAPATHDDARLVFMFPGQGAQYPGMARGLYETEAEFRRWIDRAAAILTPQIDVDLREIVCGDTSSRVLSDQLRDTRIAQPAIFTVSYALAQLFLSWGIRPAAMIGHSIGEYVAACLAGVFSVEDALWLVAERGRLMGQVSPGAMLAVPIGAGDLQQVIPAGLAVAAINAPGLSVVSGPTDAVDRWRSELRGRGCEGRLLHTSHAFHSPMMDPVLEAFTARVAQVSRHEPRIPYMSNVTGAWITPEEAGDPAYWARHLRGTVRFSEGLQQILETRGSVLLEVGPGQALTALAKRHATERNPVPVAFASMRHPDDPRSDDAVLLEALGGIWAAGVGLDWRRTRPDARARRVPLPTYPFQRERYWLEPQPAASIPPATAKRADVADWFSVPSWERVPVAEDSFARSSRSALSVLMIDEHGLGDQLATRLRSLGRDVVTVATGRGFARQRDGAYELNPAACEDYQQLCEALATYGRDSLEIVHCWIAEPDEHVRRGLQNLDHYQDRGFYSLLFLAQALGSQSWLNSCRMAVVTSNVHDVIGTEILCPEKATVLGPCRTIPLEYAGFHCTHIDVRLPPPATFLRRMLVDRLIETLDAPPGNVVAIRGSHCWRQTFVPVKLPAPARLPILKERGVYLITGGLGGIGLALAEHLAKTVRARLVLVGRTPLPPRTAWDGSLAGQESDLDAAIAHASRVEAEAAKRLALSAISDQDGLEEVLDRLCCGYVLEFFARAGVDVGAPSLVGREELARTCNVLPRFDRLFSRLLRILTEDGFVEVSGSRVRFTGRAERIDVDRVRGEALARYPHMAPLFDLLDRCVRQYAAALSGQTPAISLLFGEGNIDVFRRAVENIRDHSFIPLCQTVVRELVSQAARVPRSRTLRVLEIGGGEGLLTKELLPLLQGTDVEYHFTDLGRSFVVNAERDARRRGFDFVRFGVLDISRSPADQGFAPGSFDVVLAFNVLHATKSVAESLGHARELLMPGGLLIVQESVRPARWVDLIWGVTDGWWAFEDEALRQVSPLLAIDSWTSVLTEAGFESVTAFPRDADLRSRTDTGVLVARKGSAAPAEHVVDARSRIAAIRALEQNGAEVEVICADVADRERMAEAVDRARRRFGTIDGVVHAALVLNDGTIQLKTRDAAASVLAPKVAGTLVLKDVLHGIDLDFFVIFSSLVSVCGGAGQVDYCAASNFQDAFAHAEQSNLAKSVISINWGAWREVGLALRAALRGGAALEDALPEGMSTAEGLDAFLRALASRNPQVLASPQDASALMARRSAPPSSAPDAATRHTSTVASPSGQSGGTGTAVLAPRTATERLIADIWQEVLGVPQVGVDDNFFDLGGDSVVSLEFIAKAKKAGLRFTNRQVFEHQTIAGLAAVAGKDPAASRVSES